MPGIGSCKQLIILPALEAESVALHCQHYVTLYQNPSLQHCITSITHTKTNVWFTGFEGNGFPTDSRRKWPGSQGNHAEDS